MSWELWVILWLFVSNVLTYAIGDEGRNKRKDFWITAGFTPFLTIPIVVSLMILLGSKWRD